jgi:hypothetical protein
MTAAAISVSSSLSDLSRAGVESARVAFRIAVHVEKVSRLIECRAEDEAPESWAYVVTGLSEQEVRKEVDQYNSTTVCFYLLSSSYCNSRSIFSNRPDHSTVRL